MHVLFLITYGSKLHSISITLAVLEMWAFFPSGGNILKFIALILQIRKQLEKVLLLILLKLSRFIFERDGAFTAFLKGLLFLSCTVSL